MFSHLNKALGKTIVLTVFFGTLGAVFAPVLGGTTYRYPINGNPINWREAKINQKTQFGFPLPNYPDWFHDRIEAQKPERTPLGMPMFLSAIVGAIFGGITGACSSRARLGALIGAAVGAADFYFTIGRWPISPAPWTYYTTTLASSLITTLIPKEKR